MITVSNNLSVMVSVISRAVQYAVFLGVLVGIISLFANHIKH